jgi:hypothetical protein
VCVSLSLSLSLSLQTTNASVRERILLHLCKRDIQVYRPCKWIVLTDFSSCLKASPTVFTMWTRDVRHVTLAQQNGFGPAFLHSLLRLVKGWALARKECNKSDTTAAPSFWLANHNDWSRLFAISSFPLIWSPSFSFMGVVAKK